MRLLHGQDTVVDSSLKETSAHGTEAFPFAVYLDDFSCFKNDSIIWHWHDEAQLTYIIEGEFSCHVGSEKMHMGPGDIIFINAQALHQIIPARRAEGKLYSFLWKPELLGPSEGDLYQNCVSPLLLSPLRHILFPAEQALSRRLSASLRLIVRAMTEKFSLRELHVSTQLGLIWLKICEQAQSSPYPSRETLAQLHSREREEQRVKEAMAFIEGHYPEKLSLDAIAKAAMTNRSELCRSFRHVLDMSPGDYLMQHRLSRSLSLLEDPELRIADIAELCGFCSPSHFGSNFLKYLGCSPLQYRRQSLD